MFKKVIAIAVSMTMLFAVGCSKKTVSENVNDSSKEVVIKIMIPTASGMPNDVKIVEDKINEYIKDKINAKVVIDYPDFAAYGQRLPLTLQAGEQVDLLWANYDVVAKNIDKKAFVQLDDLIEKYGTNIKKEIPDWLPHVKINGATYGIPVKKEKAEGSAVYYKKSIVDKYNIDVKAITSYEALEPVLEKIKAGEKEMAPLYLNKQTSRLPLAVKKSDVGIERYEGVFGVGIARYDINEDKFYNVYDMADNEEFYRTIERFNKKGLINKDAFSTTVDNENANKAGKSWIFSGSNKPGGEEEFSKYFGEPYVLGYATEPKFTKKNMMGSLTVIPYSSKNPERAMMFLDLLYGDPYLVNLLKYGVEGVHFTRNEKGMMKVEKEGEENTNYNPAINWRIGNQMLDYLYEIEKPNKWELFEEFNKKATGTKIGDFVVNIEPIKTQMAVIQNVISEYDVPLNMGTVSVDEILPKFRQKLKDNGADKILAEVEKQYREWKNNEKK